MEILIKDIPAEGLSLHAEAKSGRWFSEILKEALAEAYRPEDPGSADFQIFKTGANIHCDGEVVCDAHPTCSRCSKTFRHHLEIPIRLNLAPLYESNRQIEIEQKEEVELVKDDLDFAFYDGDRFNLGDMIREQIILELPMQPFCRENCKGLCPQCGKNLNEGPCHCQPQTSDLRWSVLKSWKKK